MAFVEGGTLYIEKSRTWHALVLVSWIRHTKWTSSEIEILKHRYPEFRKEIERDGTL